jgi:hypothetical protein
MNGEEPIRQFENLKMRGHAPGGVITNYMCGRHFHCAPVEGDNTFNGGRLFIIGLLLMYAPYGRLK